MWVHRQLHTWQGWTDFSDTFFFFFFGQEQFSGPAQNFYSKTEQKTAAPECSFLQWLVRELRDGKHAFKFLLHLIWLSCPCISSRSLHSGGGYLGRRTWSLLLGRAVSVFVLLCLFVKNTALFHAVREKEKQSSWNLKWCQDIFSTQLLAINKTDILYLGHYS